MGYWDDYNFGVSELKNRKVTSLVARLLPSLLILVRPMSILCILLWGLDLFLRRIEIMEKCPCQK